MLSFLRVALVMVPLHNNRTLTKTTHNQKTEEQNIVLIKSSGQSRFLAVPWIHNPILEFCVYFFPQILSPFQIFRATHHCSFVHTICIFMSFRICSEKKNDKDCPDSAELSFQNSNLSLITHCACELKTGVVNTWGFKQTQVPSEPYLSGKPQTSAF